MHESLTFEQQNFISMFIVPILCLLITNYLIIAQLNCALNFHLVGINTMTLPKICIIEVCLLNIILKATTYLFYAIIDKQSSNN